jgi:hypothetical protein
LENQTFCARTKWKVELFWRSLERAKAGEGTAPKIARIVQLSNYNCVHRALRMTPPAARGAGIIWRSPNAIIDAQIERNAEWTA